MSGADVCSGTSRVGLLLEVGMCLQGQYSDIRAYVDAFLASNVAGNTNGMELPMRHTREDEVHGRCRATPQLHAVRY
eukprot:660950-Rhodomonas_salina.2